MTNANTAKTTDKTINTVIDSIVKTVQYEEEYARKNSDMNDPYYQGYTDALDYIAAVINRMKSKEQ